MTHNIEPTAIDVELFDRIDGSQTSKNGQGFPFHAKRRDGSAVMLVFPHTEISNIVANAAMQLAHGKGGDGQSLRTAFNTSGFRLGRGEIGGMVLTLTVGKTGNISFLLPVEMAKQLREMLGESFVRH